MTPYYQRGGVTLYRGDCLEVLPGLERVDSVVTDPPYEIGFMAKAWDGTGIAYSVELWREVLRVLKPGGHLLAFGGTRTYHRMTCAIEDAGFEIRDSLHWMYGTGFPKSLNVGEGRGTALKPGHEPIVLARKPLCGTVSQNVQAHGTGALNIDASRIACGDKAKFPTGVVSKTEEVFGGGEGLYGDRPRPSDKNESGRWPSNVLLDEDAAAELDAQSGVLKSGGKTGAVYSTGNPPNVFGAGLNRTSPAISDSGGASRFFYVAKPSRKERDLGCEHLTPKTGGEATDREDGSPGIGPRAGAGRTGGARNHHPTVKPVELMCHLVRLVTPPGGVVLDPFAGSGSTGMAAVLEGLRFIGVEREEVYAEIAAARLGVVSGAPSLRDARTGQLSLLDRGALT